MDYEISRKKHVSKLFYVSCFMCIIFGSVFCALGIIDILKKVDFQSIILLISGGILCITELALLFSKILLDRSYRVSDEKNKAFMSSCEPKRVKCFGTKERTHRKYGYDWQIIVLLDYEYYYSDWLFGYAIDNEEIGEFYIDLYINDGQYYLDINSLSRGL